MRITSLSMVITTAALMLLLTFCGKLYMGYLDGKAHKAELENRIASWPVLYTPDQLRSSLADTRKWQMQARMLAKRRIAAALVTELSAITLETIHITGMRVMFKDMASGRQETRRGTKKHPNPKKTPSPCSLGARWATCSGANRGLRNSSANWSTRLWFCPCLWKSSRRIRKSSPSSQP